MSKRANPVAPCNHKGKKVLLVEGSTDCHVVLALCIAHQVEDELFGLYDCGNDDLALKRLNALFDASVEKPDIIGLMLDADQPNAQRRWESIKGKLHGRPYDFPTEPVPSGTIIDPSEPGNPRLGFWLMPNNQEAGMLEDFVTEMMPVNAVNVIQHCLEIARNENCTTYKKGHQAKAIVHTYLAWQDEPGHPIGLSITTGALVPETITARNFTNWLGLLFGANTS